MGQGDDVVAALGLQRVHLLLGAGHQLLALVEGQALDVVGVGLGHGLGGVQTKDAHLANVGLKGHVVAKDGLPALGVDDVGGQDGELGGGRIGLQRLHLVVELVVARGGGVIARGVHEGHGAGALVQAHQSGALAEITGGEQQHAGSGGLKVLLQGGHAGSADGLPFHRHVVAVGVVGVDDHQLAVHVRRDGVGGNGGLRLLRCKGGRGQAHDHGGCQQQREHLLFHFPDFHLSVPCWGR